MRHIYLPWSALLTALAFALPTHAQLASSDATDVTQTRATLHAEFPSDASSRGFEYKYGKLTALTDFDRLALSPFSDPINLTTSGNKWSARTVKGWVESCKDLTSGQSSEMTTTVTLTAPTTVTFEWSVDSEENYGLLSFSADGTQVAQISGSVPFTSVTHTLAAGKHTLKWRYDKKSSTNVGLDLGMVKNIHIANTTPGEWIATEATNNDHTITNLYPSQTYLWRAVSTAADSDTRSYSPLRQFITDSVSVDSVHVTDITQTKARLTSQVNPGDAQVTKGFQRHLTLNDERSLALIDPSCDIPCNIICSDEWKIHGYSLSCIYLRPSASIKIEVILPVQCYLYFTCSSSRGQFDLIIDNKRIGRAKGEVKHALSAGKHLIMLSSTYDDVTISSLKFINEDGSPISFPNSSMIEWDIKNNDDMSASLDALNPNTTYWVRSYIRPNYDSPLKKTWSGTYSQWQPFNTLALLADTIPATNIKQASATINGKAKGGDATIIARGLQYRDKEGKRFTDFPSTSSDTLLSQKLTRLRPSTDYEYRAYIQAEDCDTVFSPLATFRTADVIPVKPELLTATQHTAKIQGKVISGDATIYQRGMQFRKVGEEWEDVEDGGSDSIYVLSKTDLLMNRWYEARTYVQPAGSAIIYSDILEFHTKNLEIACDTITDIYQHSAVIHGHVDLTEEKSLFVGVDKPTSQTIYPDSAGYFRIQLSNLSYNQTQKIPIWVRNTNGEENVCPVSLTTIPYFKDDLRVSNITQTSADAIVSLFPTNESYEKIGIRYQKSSGGDWIECESKIEDSTLTARLTDLQPNQGYYYQGYVVVDGVEYETKALSFKTSDVSLYLSFRDITQTKASVTFSIYAGTATIRELKYYLNGKEYTNLASNVYSNQSIITLRASFSGLAPSTRYTIKFSALVNGIPMTWETTSSNPNYYSFTTRPVSVTLNVTDVSQTSVTASCKLNYGDATFVKSWFGYYDGPTHETVQSDDNTVRITNLLPSTTYTISAYIETKEGGTTYAVRTVTTKAISCTTGKATDVSNNSAKFHGTIDCDSYSPTYRFGFQWKQMQGWATEPAFTRANKLDDGTITLGLVDRMLKPDTDYQFRTAVMRGDEVVAHGADWQTFRTELEYIYYPGTVYTLYRTDRETNSLILCGYYVAGSEPVIEQGYDYWTTSKSAPIRIPTDETMRHTLDISTLDDGNYQVRAFATTASGTVYGETLGFSIFNGGLSATADIAADSDIHCYGTDEGIVIDNATGYTAVIMDVTGRQLSHRENMGIKESFPMAQDAIYIVKISDGSVFKVKL